MSSMYAQYLKERENRETIETNEGFAIYKLLGNGECYFQDVYVRPEYRQRGVAFQLADQVSEIAKANNCHTLLGSVWLEDPAANRNLRVWMNYGMEVYKTAGNMIFLRKKIGE